MIFQRMLPGWHCCQITNTTNYYNNRNYYKRINYYKTNINCKKTSHTSKECYYTNTTNYNYTTCYYTNTTDNNLWQWWWISYLWWKFKTNKLPNHSKRMFSVKHQSNPYWHHKQHQAVWQNCIFPRRLSIHQSANLLWKTLCLWQ